MALQHTPDLEAQRAAMRKLSFLIGQWDGEGRLLRGGSVVDLKQSEEAQYKLDGLVLMIEGVGRKKAGGESALQALGIISYDDARGTYHMRAFNDGRFLETEVKLASDGQGMSWGFSLGEIRTKSELRIGESGEWKELHQVTIGAQEPKNFMELTVRKIAIAESAEPSPIVTDLSGDSNTRKKRG